MNGSETDGALVERLARGDMAALGGLYERHRGVVMTVLRQQLRGSTTDLEDLCHEVFLTLREVAPRFTPGASVRGFLVGIASRKGRKSAAVRWLHRTLLGRQQVDPEVARPHEQSDAAAEAQRVLALLPEEWRVVVVLNLVEGWTAEEIAVALDVKPATVFTRLHRARQKIRALSEEP